MTLSFGSSQEILYFVGTLCLALVTIFLCWALYEIARLLRQANEVVQETREKVSRVEQAIMAIAEKLGATSQYLGLIAEGGKRLLAHFFERQDQAEEEGTPSHPKKKKHATKLSDMPEE